MAVRGGGFKAEYTLSGNDKFTSAEIKDAVPVGIWGGAGLQAPDLTDPSSGLVRDVLTGYRLTPNAEREASPSHAIAKEHLAYNTDGFTLKDREVSFQMVAHDGGASVFETPDNSYCEYTGLNVADLSPITRDAWHQPQLLRYALN